MSDVEMTHIVGASDDMYALVQVGEALVAKLVKDAKMGPIVRGQRYLPGEVSTDVFRLVSKVICLIVSYNGSVF